jgi:hypothetical protein
MSVNLSSTIRPEGKLQSMHRINGAAQSVRTPSIMNRNSSNNTDTPTSERPKGSYVLKCPRCESKVPLPTFIEIL